MAAESCNDLICCIERARRYFVGHPMDDELCSAKMQLESVAKLVKQLEIHNPQNARFLCKQVKTLFEEAVGDFVKIIRFRIYGDRGDDTIKMMISEAVEKIKPACIATRIRATKPSSCIQDTVKMKEYVSSLLESATVLLNCMNDSKTDLLKKKLTSLKFLLMFTANHDFLIHAKDVAYTVAHLSFLYCDPEYVVPRHFSGLLETINPIGSELRRQIYRMSFLKGYSSSGSQTQMMISELVEGLFCTVQVELEQLLSRDASFDHHMRWLQQGLICLSTFLLNLSTPSFQDQNLHSLLSRIESFASEAGIVISSFYDEDAGKTTEVEYRLAFLPLQVKFNHVNIECALVKLHEATMMASLKNSIDYVREDLIFLKTSLMDSLEQWKEQNKMTDVLSLVQYVTTEAGSLIDFLSHVSEEGELERKINLLHFQLLLKFKFIKTVIRLICPVISASSTPDHPMSDLLNFLPCNFDVIDTYFNMVKSNERSSSGIPEVDEVFMGFLEYILDDLRKLLHDETKLISTLSNELKKLTQGVIVLLTFLADPPIQYIKCKKRNYLLTEIEHITIEVKSAICSLYEDASVSRITEVDHVLFRLQVKLNQVRVENGLIEQLKYEVSMTAPLKDLIVDFQEMLMSLRTFLMDSLEQCKEQHKMTDVLTVVQSVTAEAWSVISSLSRNSKREDLAGEINLLHFQLLLKFRFIKAVIRLICPDISASSTTDNSMTNLLNFLPCNFDVIDTYFNMVKSNERSSSGIPEVDEVFMGFLEYILDDLGKLLHDGTKLISTLSNELKKLTQGVIVLLTFLADPPIQYIKCKKRNYLLTEIEHITIEVKSAICSLYEDASVSRITEVDHVLFRLQVKLNQVRVENGLIEQLKYEVSMTAPLKDLIVDFQEMLMSLRTFLMDSLEQCKEQHKMTDVLTVVQSVTAEAWSVISSLSRNSKREDLAGEINLLHFQLLLKFRFIKAVIRLICPDISASSTTDNSMTNLLNFLPCNFDVIDTYFNMVKSNERSSSGIPEVDEVFMGFLEYILDDLGKLLHDGTKLISTLSNELKKLTQGVIVLLTFLADPPIQYIKCKKRNYLLTEIEHITIEVKSAICSLYEDASVSRITEVDHVLFRLQVKLNQVRVENGLIEQLKYEVSMTAPLKDLIVDFQEMLMSLRTFLMDSLEQCKEQHKMTDVLTVVQSVTAEAWSVISSLSRNSKREDLAGEINLLHFQLLLKFRFIKAVIRLICPDISASSTTDNSMTNLLNFLPCNFDVIDTYFNMVKSNERSSSGIPEVDEVFMGFLEYILDDLGKLLHDGTKLISTLSNELKKLTQGVIVLLTFLADPPIQYIKCKKRNYLLTEIEHITIEVKSAICSLYEDASVSRITEVDHVLFRLQVKLNQVRVENGLIEQLKYEVSMTAPLKDLIVDFQEMLMSLRTFLMDSLEQCKEQHKMTDVLTVVQSVTAEAWSVISSLSRNSKREDLAGEINLLHFQLLLKFRFIKAVIRLICPDISASSTTDNSMTNLLNFLPCNFDVIDTYFNMVKSNERSSSGIPEVDEVFMGFLEYILDDLGKLLHDGTKLISTLSNELKKLTQGVIVLLTFLADPPIQYIKCKKRNYLLTEIEHITIEVKSAICSLYEDASVSRITEVDHVLFRLQVKLNQVRVENGLIEQLKYEVSMTAPLKDLIVDFQEMLMSLRTFLMDSLEQCKEQHKMTDVLTVVQSVTAEAWSVISSLSRNSKREDLAGEINLLHFQLLLKFRFIKAVIRLICPDISASSTTDNSMTNLLNFLPCNFDVIDTYFNMVKSNERSSSGIPEVDEVFMGFLEYILDDLGKLLHDGTKLISTLSNELKKLTQGVIVLLTFLADPPIQYIKCKKRNYLLTEIEHITIEVKSAICSLYEDASVSRITEVDHVLFRLQVKLNQVRVENGLIEQLKYEVSMTAPLKDLIVDFQEMLMSLRTFLMDSLEQCKEQHKMTDVLTVVQSVTAEAWSVISSLSRNSKREDLAGEINLLHFQLLLKFRFIKAVIRLICPDISASSTTDNSMTNLLNFLPCNFDVIDTYFNMVKSNERSSSGIPEVDEVFMGFLEYILDDLGKLLHDGTKLISTLSNELKKLTQGVIVLLTFLADPPIQYIKCKKRNYLLTEIEHITIEVKSAICSLYEDASVSRITEVDHVLFRLQVKLNQVRVENGLIEQLKYEVSMTAPLKDLIVDFQEMLMSLRTFLMDSLEQCKEQHKMTDVLTVVQSVTAEAWSVISSLSRNSKREDLAGEINLLHFQLLLKFRFIKAVIRLICPDISASSTTDNSMTNLLNFLPCNFDVIDTYFNMVKSNERSSSGIPEVDEVFMGFLEYILDDLGKLLHDGTKLISTLSNELKKLTQGVIVLLTFLADPPIQYIKCKKRNYLLTEIEHITIEVKSAICSLYEDASVSRITEVDHVLFRLQVKLNQVRVENGLIEQLKYEVSMTAPLKDLIVDFQEMLMSLRTFLMDSLEQCKEQHKMTDVLTVVQSVTAEAWSVISSLSRNSKREDLAGEINLLHFQLLLKFRFIKAVIRLICPDISASSTTDNSMTNLLNFLPCNFDVIDTYFNMVKSNERSSSGIPEVDEVFMGFLEYILDDLGKLLHDGTKLISTLSNELKKLTQGVIVLLTFLADPPIQYIKCKKRNYLLTEIEHITIEVKSAICSLYEDASVSRITEVDHVLFRLQVKLNQVRVENGLIEQLKYEVSMTAPLKDLIVDFQEMLMSLRTFLMDSLEQCKEQHKMTDVLTVVQSVTAEAWSVISSLSCNSKREDLAGEINLLHFQLLLKFRFIKAVIRLICPDISASSTTDNSMTNLLNFLPCNFDAIDTYFNIVKSSERSSSGIPEVDEVFMGFHTYILDNLLLKDGISLAFTDTDKVKSFYHGLLVLVIFLIDPPIQYIECKKQNDLLADIGTLAIETEAAIRLTFEDASDNRKSRKVSLLLQYLTVAFKLIKCKGKLTDQLKHKAMLKSKFLDLMENAHEELIFLLGFLMDLFRQNTELGKLDNLLMLAEVASHKATSTSTCSYESFMDGSSTGEVSDFLQEIESVKVDASLYKDQTQITDILPLVQSVTTEAESFISFLSHDSDAGEPGREMNLLHFQLLLKFKFIKAAIRRICSIISASSKPDHPVIYPLNFLPTNFEAIDSYFTMLKSSKTLSSSDSSKTDDIFMGFHEYILENLLLKDGASLKLADHGLLVLVTFLLDPPIQYIECKKQNDLLADIETLAIEAGAAIRLSYEDALDSSQSRKVSIWFHLLTAAFKLIRLERNLTDLLMHKATLEAQVLDLMENAHGELIFFRVFLMDFLRRHAKLDKVDDLLMRAEVSADKLISNCSYESSMVGRNTGEMSLSLSDFIQEIKSVNVEVRELCFQFLDESASHITVTDLKCLINMLSYMLNHLHSWGEVISIVRNQIPVIKEKLEFLADILPQFNMHRELKDLMERVQNVACGEKYVIFFSVTGDSRTWFHLLYLSDVKQVLNFVETEVKTICSKCQNVTRINFPKTNGLGFLNCFLGKLEELLHSKLDLITELNPQIVLVKEGLLCLRFIFTDDEHDEVYGLMTSATEMAYKAEYVIDSCLSSSYPLLLKSQWISEVVENIKIVTRDVSENCKRKKIDVNQVAKDHTKRVSSLSANTPGANEEMAGFQDVMDKLKQKLLGGSHELDVISIFGMPGLGKTTLAKKIYSDPTVASQFDVRAVCYVTQVYSWRELLLNVLNDVLEPADRTKTEDGQLANELRQVLLTKRFLILIDDVWDTKAWDDLWMCFKSSHNKSRIILTTRLVEVARYAKCKSEPHHLRFLRDDESWKLLQEELFHGKSCPSELEVVGLGIAKSCGGLPLFIVLVAGVLKEKEKKADLWKEVEESLGSHNFGSSEEGMSIIGFSYKNLPNHLKPCFLYFGGFLRGKDVPVSKLSRVWLAEGFLKEGSKEKGSEDAAQEYLKDLIRRNLVMDMKKRSNGKLKTCRVHDLVHQFCVQKAKQDNFLVGIYRDQCGDSTFYSENRKEYRLSIYSKREEFAKWLPSPSSIRSLLFSASSDDSYPTMARDISFMFDCFKLLKVLDLESINIGDTFPSEIRSLIHMRYFAARTGANSIPSSVADLWNLETFVVKGLRGELKLPRSLLKMFKLRHIHVNSRASFNLHDDICESPDNSQLANLETFSTPCLSYGEDAEKILRSMPNLRKMRCIFRGSLDYSKKMGENRVRFPRLDFLNQLESLKLFSDSYPTKHPHEFNFPSKLRELTLSRFRLPWTQISTIAKLPNLEILKLLLKAFEGVHWEVEKSDFPELKCLKLENLNIAQWYVSDDDAFPKLESLVITKCKQLENIPTHFEDVVSLKSIEVNWCSWPVANSAQEIQTTQQEDMGNYALTVKIQPPDWARRYPS